MSSWQPTEQGLKDLLQLLHEAMHPTSGQTVQEKLAYFNEIPDFSSYLVYILTQMPQENPYVRSVAGLTLKNNIKAHYPMIPAPVLSYVKECCLQYIADPDIGKSVGNVVAAIIERGQVHNWLQALQVLMEKLDDPNPAVVENAFSTLEKICEDCARDLDANLGGVQPLEFMLPKFFTFFNHPNEKIRLHAINCCAQFITLRSGPLMNRINDFLSALYGRANDDSVEVHKAICQATVNLLEMCPNVLFPQMENIAKYILHCTQSEDSELALEACEFWLVFSEQDELRDHLRPFLPQLIPVLLKGMVYSEIDLLSLGGDEDDAHVADSEQDIKPRFHKANVVEIERADKNDLDEGGKKKTGERAEEDDEDEDDEDDFDEDEDDILGEWSLRKCSAATLDTLCTTFEGEAIQHLMPLLKTELESTDWLHRECGILALGAAAEGGMNDIAPHLPELVPYLLNNLNDPKPLVRSITCWTLGRYSQWIVYGQQNPEAHKRFFEPLIQLLLQRILDNNKRVQEAACSSFSLVEEEATVDLIPYLQPIVVTLATAFEKYQSKNLPILFDTVGTLAEVVGEAMNTPQIIETIMPPILKKWQEIPDDTNALFPLLECLSALTTALGRSFKPFAEPIYQRCVKLVCKTLEECQLAANDPSVYDPEKDYLIVSLDLISGIVQALNTDAEPLVVNTNPPVVQFLAICMQDPVAEVRQSSYAVLGDLAISCFEQIRPVLPQFMPHLVSQIDPQAEHVSVCNNATWAAGEIAIKWGTEIQPYVESILQRLFHLMVNPVIQRTLSENVAITIGRIGLIFPDVVGQHLENFIQPWLMVMAPIRDNEEKASAFSGLCEMIKVNPQGAVKEFLLLCDAIGKYNTVPPSLHESFGNILMGYKNMFGEQQWGQALASMPPELRTVLQERYRI